MCTVVVQLVYFNSYELNNFVANELKKKLFFTIIVGSYEKIVQLHRIVYFVKIMFLTLGRVTESFAAVVVVFHEK